MSEKLNCKILSISKILDMVTVTVLAWTRTTKDVICRMTAEPFPAPKIAPCMYICFASTTIVYDIKWNREANSAATFHSNYHSLPRSVCDSASEQHAPLTPLGSVRPYCTRCLLCPLPSPEPGGLCYWILIFFNYAKLLHSNCVILAAPGPWQKAMIAMIKCERRCSRTMRSLCARTLFMEWLQRL